MKFVAGWGGNTKRPLASVRACCSKPDRNGMPFEDRVRREVAGVLTADGGQPRLPPCGVARAISHQIANDRPQPRPHRGAVPRRVLPEGHPRLLNDVTRYVVVTHQRAGQAHHPALVLEQGLK